MRTKRRGLGPYVRDLAEYRKTGYTIKGQTKDLHKKQTTLIPHEHAQVHFWQDEAWLRAFRPTGGQQPDRLPNKHSPLLVQIEDTGGGSAKVLEMMHRLVERRTFAKRAVISRIFKDIPVPFNTHTSWSRFVNIIMSSMIGILMFSPFSIPSSFSVGSVSSSGGCITIPPELFQASYIMVIIINVFMLLSATETTDFNVKNMWRASFTVLQASNILPHHIRSSDCVKGHAVPAGAGVQVVNYCCPTSVCDRAF